MKINELKVKRYFYRSAINKKNRTSNEILKGHHNSATLSLPGKVKQSSVSEAVSQSVFLSSRSSVAAVVMMITSHPLLLSTISAPLLLQQQQQQCTKRDIDARR